MARPTISVRVEPIMKQKLEYMATQNGFTVADNVKIALGKWIDDFEKKHGVISVAAPDERPTEERKKKNAVTRRT